MMNTTIETKRDTWFEEFIALIKTHQFLLETDTATQELKDTYHILMNGNEDDLALANRKSSHKYFVRKIIIDYYKLFLSAQLEASLAIDFDNAEILVWAKIKNDDTETEEKLIMIEAEINGTYHKKGYDITTTIVEERDELVTPSHYIEIA